MATTAVFAEILIVGLQATVWVALAALALIGPERVSLAALRGWENLATIGVLVLAYSLGIVVDRTADSLLQSIDDRLARRTLPEGLISFTQMRLLISMRSQPVESLLDYARSRVRVARSTAFNLVLIILTGVLLVTTRPVLSNPDDRAAAIAGLLGAGIPLVALTLYAWVRISRVYYRRLAQAYQMVLAETGAPPVEGIRPPGAALDGYLDRLAALHADAERALDGLPPEALDWSPGPGMNSLAVLAVHLCGAQRYWIGDVVAREPSGRDRDAEFIARGLSGDALRERLAGTLAASRRVVEALTPGELAAMRTSPRDGREVTALWALSHALAHTATHVGHMQIARQLWESRAQGQEGRRA